MSDTTRRRQTPLDGRLFLDEHGSGVAARCAVSCEAALVEAVITVLGPGHSPPRPCSRASWS